MFYMWYFSKLNSKTNYWSLIATPPVLRPSQLSNQAQNDQKTYVCVCVWKGQSGRLVLVSTRPATESGHFKAPLHCHLHFLAQQNLK